MAGRGGLDNGGVRHVIRQIVRPVSTVSAPVTASGSVHVVKCPSCRADDTRVVDSRIAEESTAIRRRRECLTCAFRFTTFERIDTVPLTVVKSHGGREPFDRDKLIAGLLAATKGRSVERDELEQLATSVEDTLRLAGSEVSSANIGLAVLRHLRDVDEVAYLRFASVYKNFDAAADFHRELELMEKDTAPT